MKGIINFYKPENMTSHDAVNILRRLTGIKRIGHTGTLDPNVTGVLPLCIGKATRVSEYVLEANKEYVGELTLGSKTTTQDKDGDIIDQSDIRVTEEEIIETFKSFEGEITQIPPMYSAVRHKGKRLYDLARDGVVVERKPRKAIIYELEILSIKDNKIMFRVVCSKGTYIRTLCNDIGEKLKTYGYMSYLIRTQVGNFSLDKSYSREYLESLTMEEFEEILLPMDIAITNMKSFTLKDSLYDKIVNGLKIKVENDNLDINTDYKIYCKNEFIGIGEFRKIDNDFYLKMKKVLV